MVISRSTTSSLALTNTKIICLSFRFNSWVWWRTTCGHIQASMGKRRGYFNDDIGQLLHRLSQTRFDQWLLCASGWFWKLDLALEDTGVNSSWLQEPPILDRAGQSQWAAQTGIHELWRSDRIRMESVNVVRLGLYALQRFIKILRKMMGANRTIIYVLNRKFN